MIVPTSPVYGRGLYDPTGLRLTDIERVLGSGQDDVLGLWKLNAGGELDAAQKATLAAARAIKVSLDGTPAEVGAAMDARMEAARAIPQNQIAVTIEGGDGGDIVFGSRTGENTIRGGAGVDKLYAGGFTSVIYGGAGTDYVEGGGFKSHLYGGDGSGTLRRHPRPVRPRGQRGRHGCRHRGLRHWGPFRLTGGVQQSWMEAGWAYWTPFTSMLQGVPGSFAGIFGRSG